MTLLHSFKVHDHGGPKSYDQLLDSDGRGQQEFFRVRGNIDVGPTEVPTSWYLDRDVHDQEVEKIWKKVWQVACREHDVLHVGDTWVYDVAGISIIVVRSDPETIKAFYNACLHSSVTLRKCNGRVSALQCPFHGFTWSLDGELRQVPCLEQFPDVKPEEMRLPQVNVARWGGFVFINLDPNPIPFEEYTDGFDKEFERAPLDDRIETTHVQKVLPANWKSAAQEAFMEGFHVKTTHPQNIPVSSDCCSQHDAFRFYSRGILGRGIPNEYMRWTPTEQEMMDVGLGKWDDRQPIVHLPAGMSAPQMIVQAARERLRTKLGNSVDDLTEADLVDTIYYTLFPNFHPMSSRVQPQYYTFRPSGDNREECIMDIVAILPRGPNEEVPESVPVRPSGVDELFTVAPELGFLGPFLNQDSSNLSQIMKGLRNNQRRKVIFARQHELKIRHFYSLYMPMMGLD